jgi:hypothetical protein
MVKAVVADCAVEADAEAERAIGLPYPVLA